VKFGWVPGPRFPNEMRRGFAACKLIMFLDLILMQMRLIIN